MLCYVVLRLALRYVTSRHVTSRHVTLFYDMLFYVMLVRDRNTFLFSNVW